MSEVIELLKTLVAIPSQNPMGRAVAGPDYLETRLTDFLDARLRSLGVRVERDPVLPGRDNLLAFFEGAPGAPTILLDAHQDTVPADRATERPFEPIIEGGRLHARGACDVKGSMAAMIVAFERLVRERPKGACGVILALTVDEEYTHRGSSRLAESGLRPDLAIVAEPTDLTPVDTHKGAVRWVLRTSGTACHSSQPWLGDNAIYRMADVLVVLRMYAGRISTERTDSRLGPATLSVGVIEGGVSANIVPERCEIQIDRRVLPGERIDEVLEDVRIWLGGRIGDTFEFDPPWVRMPALDPAGNRDWIGPVCESVGRTLGRRVEPAAVPYGTDAGPLSAVGIPAIVLGPGDIAQAHTADEWVEVEQVERAVEVYFGLATDLGRGAT